ncbi:MAG: alpha/beta fold hydrolase [Alphaproteobacteria bacterium]|jgi:pimeloyl-ACP methyl ester carboxylesterase
MPAVEERFILRDAITAEAETTIQAVASRGERLETPLPDGAMVWHAWGRGSGKPSLFLLHGGYGSWVHWIRNVEVLAEKFTVYAGDIPGLGDSDPPPDRRDPDSIGRLVADGVLALTPADEQARLMGFSFGSVIGGHAAPYLDQAGRLRSFTLVGAGGMGLRRGEFLPLARFERDMDVESLRRLARRNLELLMVRDPATVDATALHMQIMNTTRAVTKSRWISRLPSLIEKLPALNCNVSGIWGEFDSTAYPYLADRRAFLSSLTNFTGFEVVADAGHWAMYERADGFNAAALRLID